MEANWGNKHSLHDPIKRSRRHTIEPPLYTATGREEQLALTRHR